MNGYTQRRLAVVALSVGSLTFPALVAPSATADTGTCQPRIVDMGTLGGSSSEIIEYGRPDVWIGTARNAAEVNKAVIWDHGKIRSLGTTGESEGFDLNSNGVAVGNHHLDTDEPRAYIWRDGIPRDLPRLPGGGVSTFVRRINEQGHATGSAPDHQGRERAVIWPSGGTPIALPLPAGYVGAFGMAINAAGNVVGGAYNEQQLVAWGWDSGGRSHPLARLDLGGFSQANVLDNAGRAAGLSDFGGAPGGKAALWQGGGIRSLGTFGTSDFSFALGTNGRGDFVGVSAYYSGEEFEHVFVTTASRTRPLQTLMPLSGNPVDSSGAHAMGGGDASVGGHSWTKQGEKHATVWTCAFQQAFVPGPELTTPPAQPAAAPRDQAAGSSTLPTAAKRVLGSRLPATRTR